MRPPVIHDCGKKRANKACRLFAHTSKLPKAACENASKSRREDTGLIVPYTNLKTKGHRRSLFNIIPRTITTHIYKLNNELRTPPPPPHHAMLKATNKRNPDDIFVSKKKTRRNAACGHSHHHDKQSNQTPTFTMPCPAKRKEYQASSLMVSLVPLSMPLKSQGEYCRPSDLFVPNKVDVRT